MNAEIAMRAKSSSSQLSCSALHALSHFKSGAVLIAGPDETINFFGRTEALELWCVGSGKMIKEFAVVNRNTSSSAGKALHQDIFNV